MLADFLKLTWDEVLRSDYEFKSNNPRRVIQIRGAELNCPSDAVLLVYYNVYTNTPMIVVSIRKGHHDEPMECIPGFRVTRDYIHDIEGNEETQVVYIENTLDDAIQ